jgi:hypothetical protein
MALVSMRWLTGIRGQLNCCGGEKSNVRNDES